VCCNRDGNQARKDRRLEEAVKDKALTASTPSTSQPPRPLQSSRRASSNLERQVPYQQRGGCEESALRLFTEESGSRLVKPWSLTQIWPL
jgi:hypothetical protein